jgi:hypothetical protein
MSERKELVACDECGQTIVVDAAQCPHCLRVYDSEAAVNGPPDPTILDPIVKGPLRLLAAAVNGRKHSLPKLHALSLEVTRALETGITVQNVGAAVPDDWYSELPPKRDFVFTDRRTAYTGHAGDGFMVRGKVGVLVAEGGMGKSHTIVGAAVSVGCGTPLFGVWQPTRTGRVYVGLYEEDEAEAQRRLYYAAKLADATPPRGSIHVAAMGAKRCAFLARDRSSGEPVPTPYFASLASFLRSSGPWDLVLLDPQSRIAGSQAEVDPHWGTTYVSLLEELVDAAGGAALLWSCHSPQWARQEGAKVKARGTTALEDGARLVLIMSSERPKKPRKGDEDEGPPQVEDATDEPVIVLEVKKSNYTRKPENVLLRRAEDGALVPLNGSEVEAHVAGRLVTTSDRKRADREAHEAKRRADENAAVHQAVRERPGIPLRDLQVRVCALAPCGKERAEIAVARVAPSLIVRPGPRGAKLHFPPTEATTVPESDRGGGFPYTLPTSGTDGQGPPRTVPVDSSGTDRDRPGQTKQETNGVSPSVLTTPGGVS